MDRRLGRPLPHQLPNPTRANPSAINLSPLRAYAALAAVSNGYSAPKGMFPRVTHPSAADPERSARLACIRPAASVRSEPGSNSQVQSTQHIYPQSTPALTSTHQRYIHQALIRQGRRIQPPQTHSIRPQQPYPTPPTNQQHTPVNTSTYHQSVGYSDTPYSTTPPIRQSIANTHTSNTPNKPAKPPTTYPFSQLTLCHTSGTKKALRQLTPTPSHCGDNRLGRGTVGHRAVGERGFYASTRGLSNGKCTVFENSHHRAGQSKNHFISMD